MNFSTFKCTAVPFLRQTYLIWVFRGTALKGNIPAGNETAEALTWVSKLFTKIANAKNERAKAKEQHNMLQTNPLARKCTLPRLEAARPR
jgi:hypothetical protein